MQWKPGPDLDPLNSFTKDAWRDKISTSACWQHFSPSLTMAFSDYPAPSPSNPSTVSREYGHGVALESLSGRFNSGEPVLV